MRDTVVVQFMSGNIHNTTWTFISYLILALGLGVVLATIYDNWRNNDKRRNNQG